MVALNFDIKIAVSYIFWPCISDLLATKVLFDLIENHNALTTLMFGPRDKWWFGFLIFWKFAKWLLLFCNSLQVLGRSSFLRKKTGYEVSCLPYGTVQTSSVRLTRITFGFHCLVISGSRADPQLRTRSWTSMQDWWNGTNKCLNGGSSVC